MYFKSLGSGPALLISYRSPTALAPVMDPLPHILISQVARMKRDDIKAQLEKRGLETDGKKPDLVDRLRAELLRLLTQPQSSSQFAAAGSGAAAGAVGTAVTSARCAADGGAREAQESDARAGGVPEDPDHAEEVPAHANAGEERSAAALQVAAMSIAAKDSIVGSHLRTDDKTRYDGIILAVVRNMDAIVPLSVSCEEMLQEEHAYIESAVEAAYAEYCESLPVARMEADHSRMEQIRSEWMAEHYNYVRGEALARVQEARMERGVRRTATPEDRCAAGLESHVTRCAAYAATKTALPPVAADLPPVADMEPTEEVAADADEEMARAMHLSEVEAEQAEKASQSFQEQNALVVAIESPEQGDDPHEHGLPAENESSPTNKCKKSRTCSAGEHP